MRAMRVLVFAATFSIAMYLASPLFHEVPFRWIIGGAFAAAVLLLAGDSAAHAVWGWVEQRRYRSHGSTAPDLSRRRFMVSMVAPTTALAVGGVGYAGTTAMFRVHREEVRLRGLPPALEGLRIGLITDSHIGNWVAPERLAQAVGALDEAGVHVQCFGGDLINDLSLLEPTFAALERCRAPYGMLAVLGNHEKMGHEKLPALLAAYEQRKAQGRVRLLRDSQVRIEHQGAALWVVGVDYPMHPGGHYVLPPDEHQAFMRGSADKAFHGIGAGEPVLCLTHHPDFFPIAADRGAWLTLAGHTHGGGITLFGRPLRRTFDYIRGRYQRGEAHLYVSTGLGDWLPTRVGVPTEVAILTLARSA
jgi:predicted MPP superfamily phosphohydrolase